MADFYKSLAKFLRKNGCQFVREASGDHELWQSPYANNRFVVPRKLKSRHTANAICKQAGLPKAF